MDIQKERDAFEAWYCRNHTGLKQSDLAKFRTLSGYSFSDSLKINISWGVWQAAKAQAVPKWISVEDKLPETEPNTDGVVCAVVCSLGNAYRARYMHDVDIGVDTKYWSEFAVNCNGRECEHYEINAKISHWMPLPDAPQEQK